MPKAKPFPDSEEEEKTTIESQWEDEASTTVEEGDVADKIRELGGGPKRTQTGITHTGAVDEPTVDDQHAQSAITPVRDIARLQITQGNDAGQEFEIRPGKTYTIGRAIDNDVVLTDIAVSRKHFDLRFEDGAWVIVDRGSGNGTVVNGNLEDNPFMLANADVIEIGNTVFRFDQPNAAPRPQRTMELEQDDEELSTVAGKPVRSENIEDLHQPLGKMPLRQPRPKTLPPPTPLRSAPSTQPPPLGFPPPGPAPLPASTLPLPQMANRPPIVGAGSPAMLGDPNGLSNNGLSSNGLPLAAGTLPTTIPGQGPPQRQPVYNYPQATEIPPHSVHAQMLLIQTQNRRSDGSTAHVPPTPYDGMPATPQRYAPPQLTRRAKLVLAGIGLAVFAAVMTVAIVKSGNQKPRDAAADNQKADTKQTDSNIAAKPATSDSTGGDPARTTAMVKAPDPTATDTTKTTETTRTTTDTTKTTTDTRTTPTVAKTEPAKTDSKTTTAPPTPAKTVDSRSTTTTPTPTKTVDNKTTPPAKTEPAKTAKTETKPKTPPRERREARRDTPPQPKPETTTTQPAPKRVATASDPDAAKSQADSLYRAKKFNEASAYLAKAAAKSDEDAARDLRRISDMYAKLGRAFAQGTAPATRPTEAFEALRQAQNYDRNVGNAFDGEINQKLALVAPKAAISYMANKNYPQARTAVVVAQQFGSSESVKLVSTKLESVAAELYNDGIKELESNPVGAKDKFRTIKLIVDSRSPWYQKATKQLQGG